jgi:hypothetical protein
MNTLVIVTLLVGIPLYGLLWHNRSFRTPLDESVKIESIVNALFYPSWPKKVAVWVIEHSVSGIKMVWHSLKSHRHSFQKFHQSHDNHSCKRAS